MDEYARAHGKFYIGSKGAAPGSKQFYRRVFSGSRWDEFIKLHAIGSVLQVCCGGSSVGIVRVDVDRTVPGVNVQADMLRMPFAARSFDTVACDPMYNLDHPKRVSLQRELARIARQRVIFKAPWLPRARGFRLHETTLLASHTCSNVAVLSVIERRPESASLFEATR